ncbi:hypothetical protein D9M69_630370 [compost metagenome]
MQRQSGRTVAGARGQRQDGQVPDELAHQHLPARHGVAEQQRHRAAVDLADHGVIREQHGNERNQEDRQAGQADHGDGQRFGLDRAGRRTAQQAQGKRQRAQQQGGRQDPAVAQPVADFLADDGAYRVHTSSRSSRCA